MTKQEIGPAIAQKEMGIVEPIARLRDTISNMTESGQEGASIVYNAAKYMLDFYPGKRYVHGHEVVEQLLKNMADVALRKPDTVKRAVAFFERRLAGNRG